MQQFSIYNDIAVRTGGDIYIGVVGPVRTGKSTFIKHFMELLVLPHMEKESERERTKDELPQSAQGKTIMTTEPKFIPKDAAKIKINDNISLKIRMIDCVGYMASGATGHLEESKERLVKTPWFDHEIPFTKAAEIGTKKVITEHSTIGIVVTCDGSFGDLDRSSYEAPEKKTIEELTALHKPFIVLLNSSRPFSQETKALSIQIANAHNCTVIPINCEQLKKEDIHHILNSILLEFPIISFSFFIPKWAEILSNTHWLKSSLITTVKEILKENNKMRDLYEKDFPLNEYITKIKIQTVHMDTGMVDVSIEFDDKYYYQILSDIIGLPISNEYEFISIMKELAKQKTEYDKVATALKSVKEKGYGVVSPSKKEITIDEPTVIRHGNKFGVKIRAKAPSIHLIRANLTTEIAPIAGSEEQANDLIRYIKAGVTADNPDGIWQVNIFGKTLEQLVGEGIQAKASKMTEESQQKLQDTMEKIVNDSNGGMVCIII
ncbi:MAG: stage IV sporulation protein A [Lachnospiraceae bacterium]